MRVCFSSLLGEAFILFVPRTLWSFWWPLSVPSMNLRVQHALVPKTYGSPFFYFILCSKHIFSVSVADKSKKNWKKKIVLVTFRKSLTKIAGSGSASGSGSGSGSISQRYGSVYSDPDPYQNFVGPHSATLFSVLQTRVAWGKSCMMWSFSFLTPPVIFRVSNWFFKYTSMHLCCRVSVP